jgi:hypothetical protein
MWTASMVQVHVTDLKSSISCLSQGRSRSLPSHTSRPGRCAVVFAGLLLLQAQDCEDISARCQDGADCCCTVSTLC